MSISTYGRLPLLPERTLRQHDAYEPSDSRFRAAARLQQSLWREAHGWKAGYQTGPDGKRRRLGNCLATRPAELGANFLSEDIAKLARLELSFREEGALMDEQRLWGNCLSSMPLCLNLFGPLRLDLKLATRVFRKLLPDFVRTVTGILFEHSPKRGDVRFTHDFSAFDVLIQCQTVDGEGGFVAIEIKFSETLSEPPARLRPRYDTLSQTCGCFRYPDSPILRNAPVQQLWRQEMLAAAMLEAGLYERGRFIVIAPTFNNQAQNAIALFRSQIADEAPIPFDSLPLETMVEVMGKAGAKEVSAALHRRYCDFEPVANLV